MSKLWVKDAKGNNVAQVEFNDNLQKINECLVGYEEYMGYSLGITKLKSGPYVLITGANDNFEEADTAEMISDREAFNFIVNTGNEEMLDDPKYARLKALMMADSEDDGTEQTDSLAAETNVRKQGNSLVLILTDELRQMGLDVGDSIGVILYKTRFKEWDR